MFKTQLKTTQNSSQPNWELLLRLLKRWGESLKKGRKENGICFGYESSIVLWLFWGVWNEFLGVVRMGIYCDCLGGWVGVWERDGGVCESSAILSSSWQGLGGSCCNSHVRGVKSRIVGDSVRHGHTLLLLLLLYWTDSAVANSFL